MRAHFFSRFACESLALSLCCVCLWNYHAYELTHTNTRNTSMNRRGAPCVSVSTFVRESSSMHISHSLIASFLLVIHANWLPRKHTPTCTVKFFHTHICISICSHPFCLSITNTCWCTQRNSLKHEDKQKHARESKRERESYRVQFLYPNTNRGKLIISDLIWMLRIECPPLLKSQRKVCVLQGVAVCCSVL